MIQVLNLTSREQPLRPGDPVYFEVESDEPLVSLVVMFGQRCVFEVAFCNGSLFSPYVAQSEAGTKDGRLWLRLRRSPGWADTVEIRIIAVDQNGGILERNSVGSGETDEEVDP